MSLVTLTHPERQLLDNLEHCQLARQEQGQLGRQEPGQLGRQEQEQLGRQEQGQLGRQEQGRQEQGQLESSVPSNTKVEKVATEVGTCETRE